MEAQTYVTELLYVLGATRPHTTDESHAVQMAIAVFHEMNKDRRSHEMQNQRRLVTARQIAYLSRLGISVQPVISKDEASRLITEAEQRNGYRRNYGSHAAEGRGRYQTSPPSFFNK